VPLGVKSIKKNKKSAKLASPAAAPVWENRAAAGTAHTPCELPNWQLECTEGGHSDACLHAKLRKSSTRRAEGMVTVTKPCHIG
jgi:hypothetical protein